MKYLIAIALLLPSLANAGFFDEKDKQLHIAACGMIAGVGYGAARAGGYSDDVAVVVAFSTAMVVGVAKEIIDDHFDKRDLAADMFGAIFVPLVLYSF